MKAFSLVELSIVLVILGLLVGGILAGQSLIRASQLRSVGTEYQRYITAAMAFRDKYFGLPGDITNATSLWARLQNHASCVTNSSAAVTTTGACDGNSDGQLSLPPFSNRSGESFQFWRQMALAGMLEGDYSGIAGGSYIQHATVANVLSSKTSGLWHARWVGAVSSGLELFYGGYGNAVTLGGYVQDNWPSLPLFRAEEMWNIDTKLDDGKPATGKVRILGTTGAFTSCVNSSDRANMNADYQLASSTAACGFVAANAF